MNYDDEDNQQTYISRDGAGLVAVKLWHGFRFEVIKERKAPVPSEHNLATESTLGYHGKRPDAKAGSFTGDAALT